MNSAIAIASTLAAAAIFRLLTCYLLFSTNYATVDDDDILSRALGPGILRAISAAILDPVHTWDHLEEACFWLDDNFHRSASVFSGNNGTTNDAGYGAIYTPGTRIVAPPLVIAFLGQPLVCRPNSIFLRVLQSLILTIADGVGAYCIYWLGCRIVQGENMTNEAEMERHTVLSESCEDGDEALNKDLVIPEILRPDMGWTIDLPSKRLPTDNCSKVRLVDGGVTCNNNNQVEGNHIDNGKPAIKGAISTTPLLDREPLLLLDQVPIIASLCYFGNPISMLANATGTLRSLWDALLLLSLYYSTMPVTDLAKDGVSNKIPSATKVAMFLALATYADAGYAMFLFPILLWRGLLQPPTLISKAQHYDWKSVLLLYILHLGGLHYFASLLVGDGPSAYKKVLVQTILPNVAFVQQDSSGSVPGPSMGLHWYMFVQLFDRFRPYFSLFISGLPAMFVLPLMIRLYRYPCALAAIFQLLWAIFRPTTTVHTLTLGLHLALLNARTIVRMRYPSLISFFALPVPISLFITFHRMWLVTGNGNPNYIFFQCLAYGMFVMIITMDFVSGTVKRDKVRRMIEKGTVKKLLNKDE